MERKKNILCALMLMFAASASFTCANAHEIELDQGEQLEVINNGKIIDVEGERFLVPQGAYMRINEGMIK